ncbi:MULTISPECIES: hypothetical protein [Pseudanabaena]|uniref:Uncharacterized protein n=2 Tax=Pseudanabaena TaxID=1152 RepID=L8N2K9_9CYAN|nr:MULTISPECIES: hypothetical protein [Pseudanabaena]ELS34462.1 hypothetical protein Pse7429DRAFT_0457 [Pseudanabaena biceps PCC 7429]MDG3493330.1 hypothetical protein [Pseudanabaena catenata USMAC16]
MTEQERERLYWRISLSFILISPWILSYLSRIALNPFVTMPFFKVVVSVGLIVSNVSVFLIEILYSKIIKGKPSFKFWIVNPTVEYRNHLQGSVMGYTQVIEQKLNHLEFQVEISQDYERQLISFHKLIKKPVHNFLDHAFSGKVILDPAFNGVDISVQLTFEDTVILETGEMNKLQAISEFIALKTSEIKIKAVPYTLYCSLIFAYSTTITGFLICVGWKLDYRILNSLALTGIGSILLSLFFWFNNSKGFKDFIGWRLVFSGLYLSVMPCLAWMIAQISYK